MPFNEDMTSDEIKEEVRQAEVTFLAMASTQEFLKKGAGLAYLQSKLVKMVAEFTDINTQATDEVCKKNPEFEKLKDIAHTTTHPTRPAKYSQGEW